MDSLTSYDSDDGAPPGDTAPTTLTPAPSAGKGKQGSSATNSAYKGINNGQQPGGDGLITSNPVHQHFLAFGSGRSTPQSSVTQSSDPSSTTNRNPYTPSSQTVNHGSTAAQAPSASESTKSQPTPSFANVNTMDTEALEGAGSLSSRIHASYHRSNLAKSNDISTERPVRYGGKYKPSTEESSSLAVLPDGRMGVVSVQFGSRNNATGLVSVSGADADAGAAITEPEVVARKMQSMEANATALMKSRLREHTRNAQDMVLLNYPVDHPYHQSISVITQKALESYNKANRNPMAPEAESVSGVFVTPSGVTEKTYVDEVSFDDQLREGDRQVSLAHQSDGDAKRRRRLTEKEVEEEGVFGPWRPYEETVQPAADVAPKEEGKPEEEKPKLPVFETNTHKMAHVGMAFPSCTPDVALGRNEIVVEDGKSETRYDGVVVSTFHRTVDPSSPPSRPWVLPPKNLKMVDPEEYKSFLPKKEVYTYTGHTMAVQAIRYIPRTGHCLLSASMDGFVKIWDANNNRRCMRTFKGHCKGVRDIAFANAYGTKFYSCGYDSSVILWDTEYGKVLGVYAQEALPYCVTVYPKDEGIFIVGGANRKACQYDARTGKVSLEYSAHMSNVSTATFFNDDRKLMTTGDDRRIVIWEYNLPVPVKQLADPSMHSMPAVVMHPSDKFMLAQAMSNQILVYESSHSRFRFFGGKRFKGHICSGYAIRPTCSPDGRYVASGDVRGRVFLWDWRTCRNLVTLPGHKSVTMDCQWHPLQPSRLATCSWDGTIKLWD
ncbi:WD domain, G-beta repeat containing protein, putative [Babesia bigemina]|uniref:Pre-mRNA-processing factor 17 n=1 Tax=Babesia bigemina TaxID=5866 RepID=A0A061DEB7_BABBI|nr:WD domain, G-beta repeat containing protein, putative [Babesia bigemina]CDR97010.1 WD domain, G-beta repeat containing protein, putative [Babesia bigemina]|eukprot:XP_012769196.1 WD domain, G-beta repeat containing protein, putative [Babesia bigemina]